LVRTIHLIPLVLVNLRGRAGLVVLRGWHTPRHGHTSLPDSCPGQGADQASPIFGGWDDFPGAAVRSEAASIPGLRRQRCPSRQNPHPHPHCPGQRALAPIPKPGEVRREKPNPPTFIWPC